MGQPHTPLSGGNERQKERRRPVLLLLLPLFLLITSSIAGYVLGRSAGPAPLGQMIDTILLAPQEAPPQAAFHLSGRVFYSDGSPAAGRALELHSDPITAVTDSGGGFLFPNVPEGEHTISVLGEDGGTVARREIQVAREKGLGDVSVGGTDSGKYVIALSVDVRVLEIELELEDDALYISPERITYATGDGRLFTPNGAASVRDGVIVSPGGNVYLPDGTVVFPGGAGADPTHILRPDNTVLVNQAVVSGGISVASDGTVTLPGGTVIGPGGRIESPGGAFRTPGQTGVVVDDQTVRPIGGEDGREDSFPSSSVSSGHTGRYPDSGSRPQADGSSAAAPGGALNAGPASSRYEGGGDGHRNDGSSGSADSGGESSSDGSGSDENSSASSGESSTPPDPDPGELLAARQTGDGSFAAWEQHAVIDLFYNRETGTAEKIYPGSKGFYLFQLENGRKEDLTITLNLARGDGSPYLPLRFTLRLQEGQNSGASGTLAEGGSLRLRTVLAGGAKAVCRLEWEWPYEGGRDGADTRAGSRGGDYTLLLTIHAEGGDG